MTDSLSDAVTHYCRVEDRRVVRVERDALLREERAARLAAFRERDQVAVARAEVVVHHRGLDAFALVAREAEAVLHLDDEEPPADERFVRLREAHAAHDLADTHSLP